MPTNLDAARRVSDGDISTLPFRVYGLEGEMKEVKDSTQRNRVNNERNSEAIGAQAVTIARHDEQIMSTHDDVVEVKVDLSALAVAVTNLAERVATSSTRMAWTLAGFAFTVAASAIALILTGSIGA